MNCWAKERTDATILTGVDWVRVRAELKECRVAARLSQVGLARKMSEVAAANNAKKAKTNKSTINRIENIYGEPDHVPDLDTIERWVLATGRTLGSFFTLLDDLQNDPLNDRVEAPTIRTPLSVPESRHADSVSETAIGVEILLLGLTGAVESAAERVVDCLERLAETRRHKSPRRAVHQPRRKKAS